MSDLIRCRRAVKTTQSSEPPAQPTSAAIGLASAATAPALMDHLAVGHAGSQALTSSASLVAQPVSIRQRHRPASTTDTTSTDALGSQPANAIDEYCRLRESTALESLYKFCCTVEALYGQWYLRSSNPADLYKLLHKELQRVRLEFWENSGRVLSISSPNNPKKRFFAQMQEAYRKDVERAFGILWARWATVRGPARMWCKDNLHSIMMTCIILHNMIVEDEYEYVEEESDDKDMCPQRSRRARARQYELEPSITYEYHQDRQTLSNYKIRQNRLRSPHTHQSLRHDLINHLWRSFGDGD
ncbi:uncharacterized protein LOC117613121, partial [Prunus dulcis]|uniref:uncharacterized protein LOC117613121 n=1 Tax=Prunus dulcis TaxID=3755 RepID=UPI001482A5FF